MWSPEHYSNRRGGVQGRGQAGCNNLAGGVGMKGVALKLECRSGLGFALKLGRKSGLGYGPLLAS